MPATDGDSLTNEQRTLFAERLAKGFYMTGDVTRFVARCLCADMVPPHPLPPNADQANESEDTPDEEVNS